MNQEQKAKRRKLAGAVGLLTAGAVTGGVLASTLGASAATTDTAGGTNPMLVRGDHDGPMPRSSTPVRGDEQSTSSDVASRLRAKALDAVPGGAVHRIEADAGDAAYEAHMTKGDGSPVTVKFDKHLNVTRVEDAMGSGDPAPPGGPRGPGGPVAPQTPPGPRSNG